MRYIEQLVFQYKQLSSPRLLSFQEFILYRQLSLEHRFKFDLNEKNKASNKVYSQTNNYEISPFIVG